MATMTTFDVPNLDGTWPEDLLELEKVFDTLRRYAGLKASAMGHRAAGDIVKATRMEETCERLYRQLPEWARW